jgi:site-specific recombinase XerD
MKAVAEPAIDRFCDALWLEDGLAQNTLQAYCTDLAQFAAWIAARGSKDLPAAEKSDVLAYLAHRVAQGASVRTSARLLSSLKRFYRYALREGACTVDPTLTVEAPKLRRGLPKSLSEAQVEALLAAPDANDDLGLRDRAMIETLYATGLRVSELVRLTITQVSRDAGCEAARPTGLAVRRKGDLGHLANGGEGLLNGSLSGSKRQISDEQTISHDTLFFSSAERPAKLRDDRRCGREIDSVRAGSQTRTRKCPWIAGSSGKPPEGC